MKPLTSVLEYDEIDDGLCGLVDIIVMCLQVLADEVKVVATSLLHHHVLSLGGSFIHWLAAVPFQLSPFVSPVVPNHTAISRPAAVLPLFLPVPILGSSPHVLLLLLILGSSRGARWGLLHSQFYAGWASCTITNSPHTVVVVPIVV